MPIDPIVGLMITLLTTPPFVDRSLRHQLNELLTGEDAWSGQLDAAWKAGRKAFAGALETLGYELDERLRARLDEMFASDPFMEAGAQLPVDATAIDSKACAELFSQLVLPEAQAGTFEMAWSMLGMRFHGMVAQSPELKNLLDLSREARREQQDAARDARDEVKVEKLGQLTDLVAQLLDAQRAATSQVIVENQIEVHMPPAPDPHAAGRAELRNYLGWVMREAGALWLSGIDRRDAIDDEAGEVTYGSAMRLDAVYTALLTHGGGALESLRGEPRAGAMGQEPIPALLQLNEHRRLVLLGEPGSGKSTFVNFVALCLAGEARGDAVGLAELTAPLPWAEAEEEDGEKKSASSQPWDHRGLLPLRVVLRDFATRGLPESGERGTAEHLWSFIAAELKSTSLEEVVPELKRALKRGEVLVLLDGLDEVSEADARRERIVQAVDAFAAVYSDCRYLATCRTYAYQHQRWRLDDFTVAVLSPWQPPQIRTFVERWYAHAAEVGRVDAPAERAALLERAIEASPSLRELAERPLLLTLMASLHAWRGDLPDKRVELYNDAVDLLLERWQKRQMVLNSKTKRLEPVQPSLAEWLNVDRPAVRRQLEKLAYEAHLAQPAGQQDTADIAQKDLINALFAASKNTSVRYEQLVSFLSHRAGLLVSRGVEVFSFVHRSFQEYLAACYLTELDFPYALTDLARRDPERWREVTLLAAAKAAEGASAVVWSVVDVLLQRSDDPRQDARAAHLAGLVLAESKECSTRRDGEPSRVDRHRELFDRLRDAQLRNLEGDQLKARDRAECGRSLARFGDLRSSVLKLGALELCWVPKGPVRLGSDKYSWEKPIHDYLVPYDYWLARFPITNAQYGAFVDAEGYREERFWREAKAHECWDGAYLRDGAKVAGSICISVYLNFGASGL